MTQGVLTMRQQSTDTIAATERAAEKLIAWERERHGVTTQEARQIIAREARIAPGALERLAARRLKFVERIAGPINELLVRKIERKISELEHDLFVARAVARVSPADIRTAEFALEAARQALGK